MLIVVGVVARISLTVSLTMLLTRKGFFSCSAFLLKVSICLTSSRPRMPASIILLEVMCVPAPFGDMARHQFRETDDGGKDVVEVVGDAAAQRAEGLHLLRLAELGLCSLDLLDIGTCAKPLCNLTLLVNNGHAANQPPAICPVRFAQTAFK